MEDEDIRRAFRCRAECRAPVDPSEELTEITRYELGPLGGRSPAWPELMFTKTPTQLRTVFAVRIADHYMKAILDGGDARVSVDTKQEEYRYHY